MHLLLQRVRFSIEASRRIVFPSPASNKLRGVLGARMRERGDGSYEQFFAPVSKRGPSGFGDPPRPFVLRSEELNERSFDPGERFEFEILLFAPQWLGAVQGSLADLGEVRSEVEHVFLPLDPSTETIHRIRLKFVTPTELKVSGRVLLEPEFGVLAARLRDRVGNLARLYGDQRLEMDFTGFAQRAEHVRIIDAHIQEVSASRRSGRTGEVHSLGGFIGDVVYEGELGEFMPFLRAAEWVGVGRQTSWGKGQIRIL